MVQVPLGLYMSQSLLVLPAQLDCRGRERTNDRLRFSCPLGRGRTRVSSRHCLLGRLHAGSKKADPVMFLVSACGFWSAMLGRLRIIVCSRV